MVNLLLDKQALRMLVYNTLFIPKSVKPFIDPPESFHNLLTLGARTADRGGSEVGKRA